MGVNERCDEIISSALMTEYYGTKWKEINAYSNQPKYGTKQLVSSEQAKEVRRRKITFSFSYFKQIPNFELGGCSKDGMLGLLNGWEYWGT